MMSFHLSILITPTENRDIKRWGLEEESDRERVCEREKERERIMGIALSRDSLLSILNAVNYNVI